MSATASACRGAALRAALARAALARGAPPARLRHALSAARELGVPFDTAWPLCVEAVRQRLSGAFDDNDWLNAFHGQRDAWRAAYDRAPHAALDRLAVIAGGDAHDDAARCGREPASWQPIG